MALTNVCPSCGNMWPACVCNTGMLVGSVSGGASISPSNLPSHHHAHNVETRQPWPAEWFDNYTMMPTDLGILCMRLRMHNVLFDRSIYAGHLQKTIPAGLDHLDVHRVDDKRVLIFVVTKDQHVTLEDDELFPSDRLITQLRLLMETGKNGGAQR